MTNSENKVTVQVLGSSASVLDLDEVTTVADVKAEMGVPNYSATVNGDPVDDDEELQVYDFITLSPSVKGGNR